MAQITLQVGLVIGLKIEKAKFNMCKIYTSALIFYMQQAAGVLDGILYKSAFIDKGAVY